MWNGTKFAGNCGFGQIYWRNPYLKTSFFVQWWLKKPSDVKQFTKTNKKKKKKIRPFNESE